MSSTNPVVHFEMPYDDVERVAAFYRSAFGWDMTGLGEEMGDYVVAGTTETENGRPTTPGAINGGFYPRAADAPSHPSVVIAVDDISVAVADVQAAGGTVVGEPVAIPTVGLYASFTDSEGNRVGILQPDM